MSEADRVQSRIYQGASSSARLASFGLEQSFLIEAAVAREIQRRSYGPLFPTSYIGIGAAGAAFLRIAEAVVGLGGWEKSEWRGVPRMVNEQRKIALASCPGDEMTGLVGPRPPKSKYPRGVESDVFVKFNEVQRDLPNVFIGRTPTVEAAAQTVTYWLLDFCNGEDVVRAELSVPVNEDGDGRFCSWEERIILDIPPFDPLSGRRRDPDEPLDIAVNIRPRR